MRYDEAHLVSVAHMLVGSSNEDAGNPVGARWLKRARLAHAGAPPFFINYCEFVQVISETEWWIC
jgi:hypothetical protein